MLFGKLLGIPSGGRPITKKSINDFENGCVAIGDPRVERLCAVLEERGARFVAGEGVTGVCTVMDRQAADDGSRSPRKSGGAA